MWHKGEGAAGLNNVLKDYGECIKPMTIGIHPVVE